MQSTAGIGAGRGVTLGGNRELGGLESGAVEQVALARLNSVEPEAVEDLAQDDEPRDDHGRALRLESRHSAPLGERQRGEALELAFEPAARDDVAVDPVGVVLV